MSDLYIYECQSVIKDANGIPVQVPGGAITTQKVAASGTTNRSAAFNNLTEFVLLKADADVHIAFGDNSVDAAATDFWLSNGETQAFAIEDSTHIAVIEK